MADNHQYDVLCKKERFRSNSCPRHLCSCKTEKVPKTENKCKQSRCSSLHLLWNDAPSAQMCSVLLHDQNVHGSVTLPNAKASGSPSLSIEQVVLPPVEFPSTLQIRNEAQIPKSTYECIICANEQPLDQFQGIYSDACEHIERTVCNACFYENIKCLIEDSSIYDKDVICLEPDCHGLLSYHEIRDIILIIGKNDALFEQYDQRLIFRHLEQMPEFIWCAHNCGSGQLYDPEGSEEPIVTCNTCKGQTCFKHRIVWHQGISCDQYDILSAQSTDADATCTWLQFFTKQCPKCGFHIQKDDGCDHMTCRYCKHEFCWECLVNFNLILSNGTQEHLESCSYHENDPDQEQSTEVIT